jgi:hypothetical protein
MNLSTVVFLCVVAAAAAGVAIVAGANQAVAIPLGGVAVGVAAFLLVNVTSSIRWPSPPPRPGTTSSSMGVRSALSAGTLGRLEVVALLDSLDRHEGLSGFTPLTDDEAARLRALGSAGIREIARLQALSPGEFREYLRARVSELERRM